MLEYVLKEKILIHLKLIFSFKFYEAFYPKEISK
jgi:hypothetical protein